MNRATPSWLRTAPPLVFVTFAGLTGFITYFSMYAFRKPLTAATFTDVQGWHYALDFKIAIVVAQVIGYASSKIVGIPVIGMMPSERRAAAILLLIGSSWVALVLFAVAPPLLKVPLIFLSGLCLGLIWGLVFGYMEGRRTSEILGAVLCASFIVSSGAVKSVGLLLMHHAHVPEFWMPAATGLVFTPLLFLGVWGLSILPPPDAQDEAARVKRAPMTADEMRTFLRDYGFGVTVLVAIYVFATMLRDMRDNFAPELWRALGYTNPAAVFTTAEIPVAVIALFALGIIYKVQDNRRALTAIHGVIVAGLLLLGASTLLFDIGAISPIVWMIASGAGMYLVYTPFNAMLFDRLVAASGRVATAGFLIYVADSAGYAGSCALLLWRNFEVANADWLTVFRYTAYATAIAGLVLTTISLLYFKRRNRASRASAVRQAPSLIA